MRASTGRMMNLIMKAAATPTPERHHIATSPHRNGNKRFCSVLEINACPRRSCYRCERMVHTILSKIFCCCRNVVRVVPGTLPGLAAAFIIFIILSVLARILTPPQHIVKIFCRLHRLSYYVVILRYFFRILLPSLCCAVIDFVAGIVHGVLFRYILLLGL